MLLSLQIGSEKNLSSAGGLHGVCLTGHIGSTSQWLLSLLLTNNAKSSQLFNIIGWC